MTARQLRRVTPVTSTPYGLVVSPPAETSTRWQDYARCAESDAEIFFPEKGGSTKAAKKICRSCEVRKPCLEDALAHDERCGIWGGTSDRERRKLRRQAVDA